MGDRPPNGSPEDGAERLMTAHSSFQASPWWCLLLPAILLFAAPCALLADCQLARWWEGGGCPRDIRELLRLSELFGHFWGVVGVLLAIYLLDPARRRCLPRVACASFGAGMTANLIKLCVARSRPSAFDFDAGVVASFGGWLPGITAGSSGQSFPSAHVAMAAGLAVALAWLYPAGRRLFLASALLAACQRMETSAHYLSDVLVGGAVGLLVGMAVVGLPGSRRRQIGSAGTSPTLPPRQLARKAA
jgi:membrane-associated phospholipid phosphatase